MENEKKLRGRNDERMDWVKMNPLRNYWVSGRSLI